MAKDIWAGVVMPPSLVNPGSVYQTYNPNSGQTSYGSPSSGFANSVVGTGPAVATPTLAPGTGTPQVATAAGKFTGLNSNTAYVTNDKGEAVQNNGSQPYTMFGQTDPNNVQNKQFTPLSPSALVRGTALKSTDIAKTTGLNIYKRDLEAEKQGIGGFIKEYGKIPESNTDWLKFHEYVYEGKKPFDMMTGGGNAPINNSISGSQTPTQSSAGLISPTIQNPTGTPVNGLTQAATTEQQVRNELLTKMDELVSTIKDGLTQEQNKLGLMDKSNSLTDLETQIATDTASWDSRIAGNRDRQVDSRAIDRDEAYLIRQKNLSLLPKLELLAVKQKDYDRASQMAKDNAELIKDAKLAELDKIKTELGFLTADEQAKEAKIVSQIEREESFMKDGMVKLTPTAFKEYAKEVKMTPQNEADYIQRVYNLATGTMDIWKKQPEAFETKVVKSGSTSYLVTYDKSGNVMKKEVVTGGGGSSGGSGGSSYTATEKKKLEQEFGPDWADTTSRQDQLDHLYDASNVDKTNTRDAVIADIKAITGGDGKVDTAKILQIRQNIAENAPEFLSWFDKTYPPSSVLNTNDETALEYIYNNKWN